MTKPSDLDPTTHYEIAARCEDCGNEACECPAWMPDIEPRPCLCTAPDCDEDHSAIGWICRGCGGPMPCPNCEEEPARDAPLEGPRVTDPLRGPGRCVVCGVDRAGVCGQHPIRADMCLAHGTVADVRAASGRVA